MGVTEELEPLAKVLRVFGLFPATLHREEGRLEFRKYSPLFWYSLCMTVFPFLLSFSLVFGDRSPGQRIQQVLYGVQLLVRGLPSVYSISQISRLVRLLEMTDFAHPKLRPSSTFSPRLWALLSILTYICTICDAFYFTYSGTLRSCLTRLLLVIVWQRDPQQTLLFFFFVHQITARFKAVRAGLTGCCQGKTDDFEKLRLRQLHLVRAVQVLSDAFGLRLLLAVLSIGLDNLTDVYVYVYHEVEDSPYLLVYFAMTDWFWVIYLPATLAATLEKEGSAVEEDILSMETDNTLGVTRKQVELFAEQLRTHRARISAWGVFTIDSCLHGAFLNTLLTFFIAMAQFSKEISALIERYRLNN